MSTRRLNGRRTESPAFAGLSTFYGVLATGFHPKPAPPP